jgi:sugar phosphate isomerase/epimerase
LDKIAPATEKLSAAGLKFLYHNHAHEFIRYGGVRPLDYLRDRTDAGKFGFLPDFYWIQYAGVSPVKFMEEYAGRADVVHLKDMRAAPEGQNRMAEIYEGNMDYGAIVGACKKAGVLWAAVEQDVCDRDPFESLKISFDNIVRSGQIAG